MKELEKQYDVKNGGKINIFNVNTQRIDANVLKEYKDKGVFADPYGGDEGAQKLHASGIVTLEKIVTDILGDRQIPEGEQELQAAAFVNWVSPKILSVAQKYSDLNNVDISDGIEYAIEYYTQKLKASNEFGGLSEENIPSLAEGDTDNVNLAIADEIGFNNDKCVDLVVSKSTSLILMSLTPPNSASTRKPLFALSSITVLKD